LELRITGVLEFGHRLEFKILENTSFWKLNHALYAIIFGGEAGTWFLNFTCVDIKEEKCSVMVLSKMKELN
jgi:hypothetical protein